MYITGASDRLDTSRPRQFAVLAARQHRVVTTAQLLEIGYSSRTIARREADGLLTRVHRGVYATGHTSLRFEGRCVAAALACGPEAVVSHHAAVALHDLRPVPQSRIDVTAPRIRRHAGVRCHVSDVGGADRTLIDGIAVTTLDRALLDYAEQANAHQLRSALEAAERQQKLNLLTLRALLGRSPGRRGLGPLAGALSELDDEPPWIISDLEQAFRELLSDTGIPEPRFNVLVEGYLVDCVWPEQRLVVEVDSWGFHRTRARFEDDRLRDAVLQAAGWRVLRVTYRRLIHDPAGVVRDLRRLLGG